ncbi:MAG: hypothetical protein WCG27_00950, partial [Pseudomonadota bacterium]
PALIAPVVIIAFQLYLHFIPNENFPTLSWKRFWAYLSLALGLALILCTLVDLWSFAIIRESFWANYYHKQIYKTVIESRGQVANDYFFYLKVLGKFWPWLPFVLLGPALAIVTKNKKLATGMMTGLLLAFGTILGFTLLKHKAVWFMNTYYVGMGLLSAGTLYFLVYEEILQKYFSKFMVVVAVILLTVHAFFPSVFNRISRNDQVFMDKAKSYLQHELKGIPVADCVIMDIWKGPFFIRFYLDAIKVNCGDPAAKYLLIDLRKNELYPQFGILFAHWPYALIKTPPPAPTASPASHL